MFRCFRLPDRFQRVAQHIAHQVGRLVDIPACFAVEELVQPDRLLINDPQLRIVALPKQIRQEHHSKFPAVRHAVDGGSLQSRAN